MNTLARSRAAALAAALTLTLAACGGTTTSATSSSSPSASSASAAGSAGGTTAMTSGGGSAMMSSAGSPSSAGSGAHNAADLTFAQSMIVHHQGAIAMADLAPGRAANAQVQELAVRIKAAQGPEIAQMQSWLSAWGGAMSTSSAASATGGMGGMDHGGMPGANTAGAMSSGAGGMSMPGTMTDAQMQQLTNASGAEFDRMFLQLMITHHQGAIAMADTELAQGSNSDALALAGSIKTSQTAEIAEMQQLLQTL